VQRYSNTEECSSLKPFLAELVQRRLESVLTDRPEPVSKQMAQGAQALVVECCERVKALARRFARSSSRVDVEEFYSIGMLAVCEAAAGKPVFTGNPFNYLCVAAKHAMIDEWRRLHRLDITSLDAPLSSDTTQCLYDVLPSLAPAPASPASSQRVQAVNDALSRLSTRQRAAVRRRAGLPGYGAHSLKETAQAVHCSPHEAYMLDYHGRHNLARDARLCAAVDMEVVQS
jgi:RNA polymerase sigma factor (sigma-70 family)